MSAYQLRRWMPHEPASGWLHKLCPPIDWPLGLDGNTGGSRRQQTPAGVGVAGAGRGGSAQPRTGQNRGDTANGGGGRGSGGLSGWRQRPGAGSRRQREEGEEKKARRGVTRVEEGREEGQNLGWFTPFIYYLTYFFICFLFWLTFSSCFLAHWMTWSLTFIAKVPFR